MAFHRLSIGIACLSLILIGVTLHRQHYPSFARGRETWSGCHYSQGSLNKLQKPQVQVMSREEGFIWTNRRLLVRDRIHSLPWMLCDNRWAGEDCVHSPLLPMEGMSMKGELPMMERLFNGETVDGDEAKKLFDEYNYLPWKFWVRIAVAYMEQGEYVMAEQMLRDLLKGE